MLSSRLHRESYKGSFLRRRKGRLPMGDAPCQNGVFQAGAPSNSAVRLRVMLGSSGMPGPIVVLRVPFLM
jgi:hypothetical protein